MSSRHGSKGMNPTRRRQEDVGQLRQQQQQKRQRQGADKVDIEINQYDFSSQKGWDDFYRQFEYSKSYKESKDDEIDHGKVTNRAGSAVSSLFEFEWHSSVPHSVIIQEIIKGIKKKTNTTTTGGGGIDGGDSTVARVLVVGTGNSRLPRELYDFTGGDEIQVTCLDYSQPCIHILKEMHASDCPNMTFFCGDVLDLENVIRMSEHDRECEYSEEYFEMQEEWKYDCIVDKGLMDALMCNDGWDGSDVVQKYFQQARRVMKSYGKIILVTYKVNDSKMEFLRMVGNDIGVAWKEDLEKSNGRVSFLVGTCVD